MGGDIDAVAPSTVSVRKSLPNLTHFEVVFDPDIMLARTRPMGFGRSIINASRSSL